MKQPNSQAIFRGYSANELSVQYDPGGTIDNLPEYLNWYGAESKRVRDLLPCTIGITYGQTENQKLDIFAPTDAVEAPVIIDIHGGGWVGGSRHMRSFPAETIVPNGVIWVPIGYGLAPDHKIDEIVDHVRTSIAWVYANIGDYGGNPDEIFIAGWSAGAHLAATALMPDWHDDYDLPTDIIKGACLASGIFDFEPITLATHGANDALKMSDELARRFSPLHHISGTGCPIIVAYGDRELDEFCRQSKAYQTIWEQAGFASQLVAISDANHFDMGRELGSADSQLHQAMMAMIPG